MTTVLRSPTVSVAVDLEHFTVRVCAEGEHHTVHAVGDLDLSSRGLMLRTCLEDDHQSVVVDLLELTFMDCAGYGALVEAREVLERRGGSLTLINPVGEPAMLLVLVDRLTDSMPRSQ